MLETEQFVKLADMAPSWLSNDIRSTSVAGDNPFYILRSIAHKLYRVETEGQLDPADHTEIDAVKEPDLDYSSPLITRIPFKRSRRYLFDLLAKTTLYSDLTVMVTPYTWSATLNSESCYAEEHFERHEGFSEVLALNHRYAEAVRAGRAIFLPERLRLDHWGARGYREYNYIAPQWQRAEDMAYLPANYLPTKLGHAAHVDLTFFNRVVLPYFPEANLLDVARIYEGETDSFMKFGRLLNRKMRDVSQAVTVEQVKELMEEIRDEAEKVSVEARKLGKTRFLRNAQVGFFGICTGACLASSIMTKEIVALTGSLSLWQLWQSQLTLSKEKIDLKANDFYIPYLLIKK